MTTHDNTEHPFGSTTSFTWKRTLSRRPRPQGDSLEESARRRALRARNPYKPLHLTIVYRGGAEAWYQVEARGVTWRFPGHMAIVDVMKRVNKHLGPDPD